MKNTNTLSLGEELPSILQRWPEASGESVLLHLLTTEYGCNIEHLTKGSSSKRFFRLRRRNHSTVILGLINTTGPASDEVFAPEYQLPLTPAQVYIQAAADLQQVLGSVPHLFASDPLRGVAILEDAGDTNLYSYVQQGAPNSTVVAIYESLLAWDAALPANLATLPSSSLPYIRTFDERALRLELHEFAACSLTHLLSPLRRRDLENLFNRLAAEVAAMPTRPIHRDFQSKNIMLLTPLRFLVIDSQDMCIGPYLYDVASLVFDPYITLDDQDRCRLIRSAAHSGSDRPTFRRDLALLAVHRCLKAAGRFATLATRGITSHVPFIAHAVTAAISELRSMSEYSPLAELLETCKVPKD